jgi:hypothetical protein
MLGASAPYLVQVLMEDRHERVAADFRRSSRRFPIKWPAGLRGSGRRQPRPTARPIPAPHHVTSVG